MKQDRTLEVIEKELDMAKQRILQKLNSNNEITKTVNQPTGLKPLPPNENYKKTLYWTQQGITQSEIARRLEITPISVRRYIIWLQNEGYLEKKTDVKLSKREQDVVKLKEKGFGLRKIASELKCSEQNVRYFLKSALSKGYEPKNNKEDDI